MTEGISLPAASRLSRRQALRIFGIGAFDAFVAACGGGKDARPPSADSPPDFSARFTQFEVANEPNGNLAMIIWPDHVVRGGPELQRLYEFNVINSGLMRWMPCFCGCGADGHRNNRDCYVREVRPDGSVIFDDMAPTCDVCQGVTQLAMMMQAQGKTPRQIRAAVDARYASEIHFSTPTPYPPA